MQFSEDGLARAQAAVDEQVALALAGQRDIASVPCPGGPQHPLAAHYIDLADFGADGHATCAEGHQATILRDRFRVEVSAY